MSALCTAEYYYEVYNGADLGDDPDVLLERASDDVRNVVTAYNVDGDMPEALREYVKKAVCAQAEYAGSNGGLYYYADSGGGSVSLGSFSISSGSGQTGANRYSERMIEFLDRGGLLYRGRMI